MIGETAFDHLRAWADGFKTDPALALAKNRSGGAPTKASQSSRPATSEASARRFAEARRKKAAGASSLALRRCLRALAQALAWLPAEASDLGARLAVEAAGYGPSSFQVCAAQLRLTAKVHPW